MTMRTEDAREIVQGTVDHFRVRCEHRHVSVSDEDLHRIMNVLGDVLRPIEDNSADTGGEWDNA